MSLVEKTKTALDESRMLMLGAQILLGFQFQAPFQNAFVSLSPQEKQIELVVLGLTMAVVALPIMPSSYHRIVLFGEASGEILVMIDRIMLATLAGFAVAMALDVGIVGTRIAGAAVGVVSGLVGLAVCGALWLGPWLVRRKERNMPTPDQKTPMAAKIDYVLTEARVILPGAQALLGFQFAIVLTQSFAEMDQRLKLVHGAALALIVIATALLVSPAAFHRIAYAGHDDPAFQRMASRLILLATAFLAFGISGDTYVVAYKITGQHKHSLVMATASLAVLIGLWQLWPWLKLAAKRS